MIGYEWFRVLDTAGYALLRILLSILWQSTILLLAAGALAFLLRRRSETVRHTLWTAAVLAIPLLPLLSWSAAKFGSPHAEIAVVPLYKTPPGAPPQTIGKKHPASAPESLPVMAPADSPPAPRVSILDYPWALGLAGYLSAVSALLLWMAAGRFRIRRWIIYGEAVLDPRVLEGFEKAGKRLDLTREYPIIEHPGVPAPLTSRILRPVIILPAGFASGLSDAELRATALHELAHIRRRDTLVFTLVALVRAVFFFQPLVWYAARRVSYLAETACDTAVLDAEEDPVTYAELLTRIAFRLPNRALSTEMAAGILFSKSVFFRRIREILSDRRERLRKISRWALVGIACMGVLSLLVTAALPLGEKSAQEKVTISGRVLHEGKPVAGAIVYASRQYESYYFVYHKVAKTGKNGSFSFRMDSIDTEQNSFVVASHPAFAIGWNMIPSAKDTPDSVHRNMTVELDTSQIITGVVQDTEGKPIREAVVCISILQTELGYVLNHPLLGKLKTYLNNTEGSLRELTVRTDRYGRFTVPNLPGKSSAEIFIQRSGFAGTFAKDIPTDAVEFLFTLQPEGRIEGQVMEGSAMKPARGVRLAIITDNWFIQNWLIRTDRHGRYVIPGLPAGKYTIGLKPGKTFPEWTVAPVAGIAVEEGKTVRGVNLPLVRGGVISGKLMNRDTGEPLSGKKVQAQPVESNSQIIFDERETDASGTFRLRVPPGEANIWAYAPPVRDGSGSSHLPEIKQTVTVAEGETKADVNLLFSTPKMDETQWVKFTGKLLDPENGPVADALVLAYEKTGSPFNPPRGSAVSDEKGIFVIDGEKAGITLIIEAEQKDRKLIGREEFRVDPDSVHTLRLQPYKTVTVKGRVIDYRGEPFSGVDVSLLHTKPGFALGSSSATLTRTDGSGWFTIRDVLVGEKNTHISLDAAGYKAWSVPVESLDSTRTAAGDVINLGDIALKRK